MSAIDIVKRRTGMSDDDAQFYCELAEAKVRAYLRLKNDADLSQYLPGIAEIAQVYWSQDQATANRTASGTYGVQSESFSEGGVSTSRTLIDGSKSVTDSDTAITRILESLVRHGGVSVVRFL